MSAPAPRPFQIRRKAVAPVPGAPAPVQETIFKNVGLKSRIVLEFRLAPTDVTYANALRRAILTEVETVGFRADILDDGSTADVYVSKNSTPMSNEMLAHRVGLLPIFVSNPLDWNPDEYIFRLNVKNESADPRDVVAADIQVLRVRGPEEDPLPIPSTEFFHLDPVSKETPLLAVLKGKMSNQEPEAIILEAKATVGTGRENARFIPTSQCSYRYTLDTDPERRKEFFEGWLQAHKKMDVGELEANPARKKELENEFNTMEVNRCYMMNEFGEPNSFDFVVESIGALDPYYIVGRALAVLQAKLLRYASIDSGDLPENVRLSPADARMKGFDFIFTAEDHTLGTLLQTWLDANLMDTGGITFVGYKVPHPLKDEMVLRVGVEDGKELSAREAVGKAARALADQFKTWAAQWQAAGGGTAGSSAVGTVRAALASRRPAATSAAPSGPSAAATTG